MATTNIDLEKRFLTFDTAKKLNGFDMVVLNIDDDHYISSPYVTVDDTKWTNAANGTHTFVYQSSNSKWRYNNTDYTTSDLASTYGLVVTYSSVTSAKNYDTISVYKKTVDSESTVTAELTRSGKILEADCPLVKPSQRQAIADAILADVYGYEYQPYTATGALVEPAAELGDAITAYGVYSGLYKQDIVFNRLFASDISAPVAEETEYEFEFLSSNERKFKRALAEVAAEISIFADEINAKVSKTGGNPSSFAWSLTPNGFVLYADGSAVFTCNSNGIVVNGDGTFTGDVYASNILYGGTDYGYFNGGGITAGSIIGAVGSALSSGVLASLGYADLFNSATASGTSTYPSYFTAGRLISMSDVYANEFETRPPAVGESGVTLSNHYHSIIVSGGTVTIGQPYNDSSAPSFNIADTQYYQDGVSAATAAAAVASREVLSTDSSTVNTYSTNFNCQFTSLYHPSGTSYQYGRIAVKNAAGNTLKTLRIQVPYSSGGVTVSGYTYEGTNLTIARTHFSDNTYYDVPLLGDDHGHDYEGDQWPCNLWYWKGYRDGRDAGGGGGGGGPSNRYDLYCTNRTENQSGLVTCDFSIGSYSGLPFHSGNTYDFYRY